MSEPSHAYRRLTATYSGAFFGVVVGTMIASWWLVAIWFLVSVIYLLMAAAKDEPDWPDDVEAAYRRRL